MNRNNWADWQNHLRQVEEDKRRLKEEIVRLKKRIGELEFQAERQGH